MAPKKRNNKIKKNQEEDVRPPTIVPCQQCGEGITVPKTCRHGKKLINCQGTGCNKAHIEDHKATCTAAVLPAKPDKDPATQIKRRRFGKLVITPQGMAIEAPASHDHHHPLMSQERISALGALSMQLNAVVKNRGGKAVRYIDSLSFYDWLLRLEKGPLDNVHEWTEKMRNVAEGDKTADEIGYDDEESEAEGDACPTPENDE